KKESKSERNCFEMFGCSLEFRNKYGSYKQKKSVLMGYIQQRKNAAKRNIDWNITFPDWLEIWQDSGHLENRGRGTGKYAMTRVCDIGGYTKDNVVIKSFAENAQEARDMDAIKGRWQSVEYNGVVYRSLNRLCDDLHLPVGKIRLRLKCGMSLTEAIERKIKWHYYRHCTITLKI
ncbi:hypothetical protein, partial [Mycoplasmopsis arginini]|uniref:hypothetical protein n=1 Tax=Mycoplasmopsis arginini TaxID=2094 RepID=UPI00249E9258